MWKRLAGKYGGDTEAAVSFNGKRPTSDSAYKHDQTRKGHATVDEQGYVDQLLINQHSQRRNSKQPDLQSMSHTRTPRKSRMKPPPIHIPYANAICASVRAVVKLVLMVKDGGVVHTNDFLALDTPHHYYIAIDKTDSFKDKSPPEEAERTARIGKTRPASSIYSQPSPPADYHIQADRNSSFKASTKVIDTAFSIGDSGDFCAVKREEACDASTHNDTGWSTINDMSISPDYPAPLNVQKRNNALPTSHRARITATAASLFSKKDTIEGSKRKFGDNPRWDPLTGEPTKSSRGQPSQVKPRDFSPIASSFLPRGIKHESRPLPDPNVIYRGGHGRNHTLPTKMQHPVVAPDISKQNNDPRDFSTLSSDGSDFGSPITRTVSPVSATSGVSFDTPAPARFTDSTVTNISDEPRTPPSFSQSQPFVRSASATFDDRHEEFVFVDGRDESSLDTVKPYYPGEQQNKFTSSTSQIERNFDLALNDIGKLIYGPARKVVADAVTHVLPGTNLPVNNNTEANRHNPPLTTYPKSDPSSILERKRPHLNHTTSTPLPPSPSTQSIHRKPMSIAAVQRLSSITSTTSNTSKSLPAPPSMSTASDLISSLEARIADLSRRHWNLERSIHQMTQLMPPPGILGQERARRAEEERKVRVLEEDLLAVRQEEHELGLKLYRAYKREAKEAKYEPQSLWVRRVTG